MNARTLSSFVVLGAAGLLLGGFLGAYFATDLWPARASSTQPTERDVHGAAEDSGSAAVLSSPAIDASATSRTPISDATNRVALPTEAANCPVFGDAQRRHGETGIVQGWKSERQDEPDELEMRDGMTRYEGLVQDAPAGIGRELARKRNAAEAAVADAARGGLFALLAKLDAGGVGPLVGEVRDEARLSKYFPRMSSSSKVVDGAANRKHPDKELEDGATLSFSAGVFLVENLMREKDPFPRDVTITGAGMDATMLVLSSTLYTSGELVNLTLRDCTVHTNGHYLFDLRVNPAALTFERVRFVGFDTGAGGSCLLGTHSLAIRARDCRFTGGYGRSPQHCTIFDVRTDALLARFERCRIEQVEMRPQQWRPGATLVFVGCTLTDLIDTEPIESSGHAGLVLDGCSIAYLQGGWSSVVKKDLNELFPSWEQRIVR